MSSISHLRLRDIMSARVSAVAPDAPLAEATRLMAEGAISCLVVRDRSSRPVGILTERDVARLLHDQVDGGRPICEVMSSPVLTASPDLDFRAAFTLLRRNGVRHLVIVDQTGHLAGVASETDFRNHLGWNFYRKIHDLTAIMDLEMPTLAETDTLATALDRMVNSRWDCVIVARDRRPVGIVTERDLPRLLCLYPNPAQVLLTSVMTCPVQTLCISDSTTEAASLMSKGHTRHMPVVDDQGAIVGMVSQHRLLERLGTEIFEEAWRHREIIQTERNQIESRLQAVLEATDVTVWEYDCAEGTISWTPAKGSLLGYAPGQEPATLEEWMAQAHPEDVTILRSGVAAALEREATACEVEYRARIAGNHWRWLHMRGQVVKRDEKRRPLLMVGIIADIEEARQNQRRLDEKLRFAASVFSEASEGIVITAPDGRILDVNQAFSDLTGYHRDEVLGCNPRLLQSGRQDKDFYDQMWHTLIAEGRWRGELWNRRRSGELYCQEMTLSAVKNSAGITTHYLGLCSDVTERKRHQDTIERLAYYDALTGLPNRILLADRMDQALARAERQRTLVAVCYLDLDNFKPVNDSLGHKSGDSVLVEVAHRLLTGARAQDTVARLGGDEFVLLLTDLSTVEEGENALARILETLRAPWSLAGIDLESVSASVGVTLFPLDGADADTLLRHADQAMYAAKQAGRNTVQLFDADQDMKAREHRERRDQVRQALEDKEFALYWQPKVDMHRGCVVGVEALIRWPAADGSIRLPGDFLPGLEHDQMIVDIGDWVLAEAFAQLATWQNQGLNTRIAVNVAARQLQDPEFPFRLEALLQAYPSIVPEQVELEILETAALEDTPRVQQVIHAAKALGVRLALDDFGTGYSSMKYFRRIPADTVKIDRSFVRDMLNDREARAIVEGILGLTSAFGKEAVAEGVECLDHSLLLLHLGCPIIQGYAVARPMPAVELPAWVESFLPDPAWSLGPDALERWSRPPGYESWSA